MPEKQEFVPGSGEHPLYPDAVCSCEFSVAGTIPEWDAATVAFGLEDDVAFTAAGPRWIDGYPRSFYLIR